MDIDWNAIQELVVSHFGLGEHSIHGPEHWERVERYAVQLATHNGGDLLVVRLFAKFHDVCRQSDGIDDEHGARGAELARQLRDTYLDVPDDLFDVFQYACRWHTGGKVTTDPTIGACWDADRLDLWRVGFTPKEQFMSTEFARELVRRGHIGPRYLPPMP
ncbi:MAG TPA: hypothetical protein VHV83_01585 [Armatimonadota bacterium]|nr:hypothetical protein [Armatimonadota bacterium]